MQVPDKQPFFVQLQRSLSVWAYRLCQCFSLYSQSGVECLKMNLGGRLFNEMTHGPVQFVLKDDFAIDRASEATSYLLII